MNNPMNTPIKKQYQKLAQKVIKSLESHHFDAYYADNISEANQIALSLIPATDVVSWGGSITLEQIGILDLIKQRNTVLDRSTATHRAHCEEIMKKALTCDTYLMSSNAITEDGELLNIDGNGNRVAALIFGPKNVIIIAGMNKIVRNTTDALQRVRHYAAPVNVQRFENHPTPCYVDGACHNCYSANSICANIVNTRISRPAHRIKIILVGENLGF